jgi:hypothetical protein
MVLMYGIMPRKDYFVHDDQYLDEQHLSDVDNPS